MRRQVVALSVVLLVIGATAAFISYQGYSNLQGENDKLRSSVQRLQANITEIQNELSKLQSVPSLDPPILLRTFGTSLASYVERPDGIMYLRLTETGGSSGAEAALAATPFNATIAGNSIEWKAVANSIAADPMHTFWPMVLENSPGGTDAIEFEDAGGVQQVSVVSNGSIATSARVNWNPTVVNTFKIVVEVPGKTVDFYINNQLVKSLTTNIPKADFLLAAGEVKGSAEPAPGVGTLDVYGGLLVGS